MSKSKVFNNGWLKLVGIVITIAVLFAGIVSGYTVLCQQQKELIKEVATIKSEGSDLAKENEKRLLELSKDVKYMRKDIRRIGKKLGVEDNNNE